MGILQSNLVSYSFLKFSGLSIPGFISYRSIFINWKILVLAFFLGRDFQPYVEILSKDYLKVKKKTGAFGWCSQLGV